MMKKKRKKKKGKDIKEEYLIDLLHLLEKELYLEVGIL